MKKYQKTIIISLATALALWQLNLPTMAANTNTNKTEATKVSNLKSKADKEIDRRVTSLSALDAKIDSTKKLTDSDKTALKQKVDAEVASLTNLKSKIDADADLATLKVDVQSIVQAYRVYALYIPQMHIIIADDTLASTADQLDAIAIKLQARISGLKNNGKDVTGLEKELADMKLKIGDAQKQLSITMSEVIQLVPDGYPGNKNVLQTDKNSIQTSRATLQSARVEAASLINEIKNLQKASANLNNNSNQAVIPTSPSLGGTN